MSFEPGPINPGPHLTIGGGLLTPAFDLVDILPVGGADRLRALRQNVTDRHALTVPFLDRQRANTARGDAERHLQKLLAHRSVGGFELHDADIRVIAAQDNLAKLAADAKRLSELDEVRSAAWQSASHLLVAVETWLRDGRPAATILQDWDGDAPKLAKGDSLIDAIEVRRRRGRELKATLHTIRSAPFPSTYAKSRMRQQIEAIAMIGAPNVSDLLEHDRQIIFPTTNLQSHVYAETKALGFAELPDTLALFAWLHRDVLIKKLDAEIDTEADGKSALSHDERQRQEIVVLGDLLAVEREESSLVWKAMHERLPVEHRADCAPEAILQVVSVVAPRVTVNGSSREHAVDVVHTSAQRWRR